MVKIKFRLHTDFSVPLFERKVQSVLKQIGVKLAILRDKLTVGEEPRERRARNINNKKLNDLANDQMEKHVDNTLEPKLEFLFEYKLKTSSIKPVGKKYFKKEEKQANAVKV